MILHKIYRVVVRTKFLVKTKLYFNITKQTSAHTKIYINTICVYAALIYIKLSFT